MFELVHHTHSEAGGVAETWTGYRTSNQKKKIKNWGTTAKTISDIGNICEKGKLLLMVPRQDKEKEKVYSLWEHNNTDGEMRGKRQEEGEEGE